MLKKTIQAKGSFWVSNNFLRPRINAKGEAGNIVMTFVVKLVPFPNTVT